MELASCEDWMSQSALCVDQRDNLGVDARPKPFVGSLVS